MQEVISWIMDGPAWIQYRCLLDLLDKDENNTEVKKSRKEMLGDEKVLQLISDLDDWGSHLMKRHNDAVHPIHKLSFLADLGVNKNDKGLKALISKIMKHRSDEGPFQVLSNYPATFGGSGKDEWLWCLCDAPTVIYGLMKMGMMDESKVNEAVDYIAGLVRENGWPCKATAKLGKFKGPGKASDPCPYANLITMKVMALRASETDMEKAHIGGETALELWENSHETRPFLFRMGNDFRKLKVPFVWYDILHLADVLSKIPSLHQDKRLDEIISIIQSKADENGHYRSESIWIKWKGWEFCQKKEPSRWVTLCVLRVLKRIGRWSAD